MSKFSYLLALSILILVLFTPRIAGQSPHEDSTPIPAAQSSAGQDGAPRSVLVLGGQNPNPSPMVIPPAAAEDMASVAAARGWTIEQVIAYDHAVQVMGQIAKELARRFDIFVATNAPEDPEGRPSLFIKGPVDDYVRSLVGAADIQINVFYNLSQSGNWRTATLM